MGLWSKAKKVGKKVKNGVSKTVNAVENAGDKVKKVTDGLSENAITSTLIDAGGAYFGAPNASEQLKKAGAAIESTTDGVKAGKNALYNAMDKAEHISKIAQNIPKEFKESLETIQDKVSKQYSSYTRDWEFKEMPENLKKYDFSKMWS